MRHQRNNIPQPKWMMSVVYLILLLLAVGVIIGLRNCSAPGLLISERKQGFSGGDTLDVAMLYSPMNYYIYEDTLGGFSYDLLRQIAENEKIVINFIPTTSSSDAFQKLESGQVDLIASLPVSSALPSNVILSDSIFTDRLVVVYTLAPNEKFVESPFSLAGEKMHIEAGSAGMLRLENLQQEIGDTIYIEEHPELSDELIAMKVARGDFKFGVVNSHVADGLKKQFPNLKAMPVGFTQLQAWALADSTKLRDINSYLQRASKREATSKLRQRYGL